MTENDKYQEALEKQQVQKYMSMLRSKSVNTLINERQKIIDRIICFELYYGELNRDLNRAIRAENWTDVLLIRQKVRANADDRLELVDYDTIIAEKQRFTVV